MKGLIFTYVITFGGAAAAVFQPFYGLLAYVMLSILKPEALWHWSVPIGYYIRIVAIAMLVGWLLRGFGNWRLGRAWPVMLAFLGFWGWTLLSAALAPNSSVAWGMEESLAKTFIPVFVGITLIDSVTQLKQLAWVIVLSQGYLSFEINMDYFAGAYNPLTFDHGSLDNNSLAITTVTALGVAFFLGLHAEKLWQKGLAFLAAAFMAHLLLIGMSRGGMLAAIMTAATIFWLMPKRPAYVLLYVLGIGVIAWLTGDHVLERFNTTFEKNLDKSAEGRLEYWSATLEAIEDYPLVGVGPDHWRLVTDQYAIQKGRSAHSTWLQAAVEFGVPAALLLIGFYALILIRLWPLARGRVPVADPWFSYAARMVIAGLVGFLISAQFVTMYGVDLPYFVGLLGAGVIRLAYDPALAAESNTTDDQLAPTFVPVVGLHR